MEVQMKTNSDLKFCSQDMQAIELTSSAER